MVEAELNGIDVDGIWSLVDLARLMFIDEENVGILSGSCKDVVDGGKFTRNNNRNGKSEVLQAIDVHSMTNAIDKIEVSMVSFFVGR